MTDDWQPISTAPRDDGAEVLIWAPSWGGVVIGRWHGGTSRFWEPETCRYLHDATHWRPLPPPPREGGE